MVKKLYLFILFIIGIVFFNCINVSADSDRYKVTLYKVKFNQNSGSGLQCDSGMILESDGSCSKQGYKGDKISFPKGIAISSSSLISNNNGDFFVEENNIWVFDFDGCTYANYLYDVASFVQACFLHGYGAGKDLRKLMHEDMLHYFKIGYNLNMHCPEHFWDDLELFIAYRTAITYMALLETDHVGVVDDTNKIKQFFAYIISQDDIMDAMTGAMKNAGGLI